jgi:ankyrin repeat protein
LCPSISAHFFISTSHASHFVPFDLISDQTPLHKSARNGHADLCQMLVLAGCNVNAKSALNMYSSVRSCLMLRASPFRFLVSDRTPLHDAALKGCVNVCTLLVNAGAVVDAKDSGCGCP